MRRSSIPCGRAAQTRRTGGIGKGERDGEQKFNAVYEVQTKVCVSIFRDENGIGGGVDAGGDFGIGAESVLRA